MMQKDFSKHGGGGTAKREFSQDEVGEEVPRWARDKKPIWKEPMEQWRRIGRKWNGGDGTVGFQRKDMGAEIQRNRKVG